MKTRIVFSEVHNYVLNAQEEMWVQYDVFMLILAKAQFELIAHDIPETSCSWKVRLLVCRDDWDFIPYYD